MSDLKTISSESPGWNSDGDPDVTVSRATGALRERVLRRFGRTTGVAEIVEETFYGGYSDYSQENNRTFTVRCGSQSIRFDADSTNDEFEITDDFEYRDSVFARFHAWLRASEDPEALIREWFEPEPSEQSTDGKLRRYPAKPGTLLWTRMRRESHYGLDEMYAQWYDGEITLVGVYLSGTDDPFRGIGFKRDLGTHDGDSPVEAAEALAITLTDRFMPGSRFWL